MSLRQKLRFVYGKESQSCGNEGIPARERKTDNGQPDGKVGSKILHVLCVPETPPSPDAKRMLTPRAPRVAYELHNVLNNGVGEMRVSRELDAYEANLREMVFSSWS